MEKIGSILDYLRNTRKVRLCWRMDWETEGVEDSDREAAMIVRRAFSEAVADDRFEEMLQKERTALRRAARKYGSMVGKLEAWADPRTGIIHEADVQRMVKYAKLAASNLYAAHPEMRVN